MQSVGGIEPLKLMEVTGNRTPETSENTVAKTGSGFTGIVDMLSRGINSVHNIQQEAKKSVEKAVTGDAQNIHDVVIAVQEANMAFQFAVRTRNKAIDAYNEVMRMNV
jgi:flagellar hook-basal body complex protein FliE